MSEKEESNYQVSDQVLIDTARKLPVMAGDQALTDAIMAMVDVEIAAATSADLPVETKTQPWSEHSFYLMSASFVAFNVAASGFSPEGLWSAGSWGLALLMVALLKPLIEQNNHQNLNLTQSAKA